MESKGMSARGCAGSARTGVFRGLKHFCGIVSTSAFFILSAMPAYSAQATLSWDQASDPGVAGYKLHYGDVPGSYSRSVDTGKTTSRTLTDLAEGKTYYFAATAYDSGGTQSGYSNEVSKSIPLSTLYSLMIAKNGSGSGTVTGSGINCGSVCSDSYAPGTLVILTATPAGGSAFAGWSGGGCSGTGNCTLTMNSSASVTATFNSTVVTHDITATATGNGSVTAVNNPNVTQGTSGDTTISMVKVAAGANQQFLVSPNTGNYTASVSVDGTVVATNLGFYNYTFSNVTADHAISAVFAVATYSITPTSGAGGSVSPTSALVNHGGSQTFTITPDSGYRVSDVKVDGTSVGAVTSYTFSNVAANHTISAAFEPITSGSYTITSWAGAGGSVSPSGDVTVSGGASMTFTMRPSNKRYRISDVKVDGASKGAISSYTFSGVGANHSIQAYFSKK